MLRGSFCVSFWCGGYGDAQEDVSENKYFPVLYNGNGFAGGENGKVLDIGRKMQCMGVQEWKITGFGKGVL